MRTVFVRNFMIFVAVLLLCAGTLVYGLVVNEKNIEKGGDWVMQARGVVMEAEQLSTHIESMLASQRGYLLTADEAFLGTYRQHKGQVSELLAKLTDLTEDNASQQSRLDEIRNYYNALSQKLEERSAKLSPEADSELLTDVEIIDGLRDDIMRIHSALLDEEYSKLKTQVSTLERKRSEYFKILLVGIAVGTLLLLIFNAFLLRAQQKRSKAEKSLQTTEERLKLAIDGTQDGIFDWDIETGKIFYSRRIFEMLGYKGKPVHGKRDDFASLVHPEDLEQVEQYAEQYLNGELSEYEQDYRVKHASGRWVWIKSRAKAIFDKNGKAIRLVGAHTDITEIVKRQEELKREKNEAEEASEAKSEFLAHMSHEIRTPLTAINGIAEILGKKAHDFDEKQQQLIKTLGSSTASLKELINDILDFSKIESGEIELDEKSFELEPIFQETISMMALKANEKGISFVFDYDEIKDAEFFGDGPRIRQILVNLINNAIKFTDKGGVSVKCDFEDRNGADFLRIDVSDTGIGIAPDEFDLVFERFKQADSSVSRKHGGTGLGLPISRKLAKLMGGDIFLSSEPGKGSTFSVLLPLKITGESKEKSKKTVNTKKLNDQIQAKLNNETKMLVVEDYEGNVVVVSYILDEIGVEYDVARNGREAVELWKDNYYNLVLMDVQMPEMDGFTATAHIREQEQLDKLERTPIIGMTAHALIGDKDKCIAVGMDSYLPKPLVEADLKREILKYLTPKKKKAA